MFLIKKQKPLKIYFKRLETKLAKYRLRVVYVCNLFIKDKYLISYKYKITLHNENVKNIIK